MSALKDFQDDFFSENAVESYYDSKMPELDKSNVRIIVNLLKEQGKVEDGKKIGTLLDVACGSGFATSLLATYFENAIGIDNSPGQVSKAREISKNVEFKVGTAESIPVEDSSVDVVTMLLALHFVDINSFVNECRRVLKPGGVAVFYTSIFARLTFVGDEKLPIIEEEITKMKEVCLSIAIATSHPERHFLERCKTLYKSIDWPNKRRVEGRLEFESNLAAVRDYHLSVPFYARLGASSENPMIRVFHDVKKIWAMEDVDDKDVKVLVSFAYAPIILLSIM